MTTHPTVEMAVARNDTTTVVRARAKSIAQDLVRLLGGRGREDGVVAADKQKDGQALQPLDVFRSGQVGKTQGRC